ncbi:MAG: hypothetical protein OXU74_09540 [Gemmatimonadota bacterium]|nr:hypothetical protein [Gemmatimonadota bacterium]
MYDFTDGNELFREWMKSDDSAIRLLAYWVAGDLSQYSGRKTKFEDGDPYETLGDIHSRNIVDAAAVFSLTKRFTKNMPFNYTAQHLVSMCETALETLGIRTTPPVCVYRTFRRALEINGQHRRGPRNQHDAGLIHLIALLDNEN